MRLALAQYSLGPEVGQNLAKALHFMRSARRDAADFIVFPELCLSPFFPQRARQPVSRYTMHLDDHCIQELRAECSRSTIAASPNVYLKQGDRAFDASLMIANDGTVQGISKMVHIAQLPGFYEQDYYSPSDTGFHTYRAPFGAIGIVVCFDRHFPESIRTCALRGASLIVIPTANTIDEPREMFEWELRTAAFQNGVYVAMCNRVGEENGVVYCGESMVVDPEGNVLTKADRTEALAVTDLDLTNVPAARAKRPYLSLRRPVMYD
jgi:predicted amidohydrolase